MKILYSLRSEVSSRLTDHLQNEEALHTIFQIYIEKESWKRKETHLLICPLQSSSLFSTFSREHITRTRRTSHTQRCVRVHKRVNTTVLCYWIKSSTRMCNVFANTHTHTHTHFFQEDEASALKESLKRDSKSQEAKEMSSYSWLKKTDTNSCSLVKDTSLMMMTRDDERKEDSLFSFQRKRTIIRKTWWSNHEWIWWKWWFSEMRACQTREVICKWKFQNSDVSTDTHNEGPFRDTRHQPHRETRRNLHQLKGTQKSETWNLVDAFH